MLDSALFIVLSVAGIHWVTASFLHNRVCGARCGASSVDSILSLAKSRHDQGLSLGLSLSLQ